MTTPNMPEMDTTMPPAKSSMTSVIFRVIVVIAMWVGGFIAMQYMPERIPTHWGIDGQPNSWSPRFPGAFIGPIVATIFLILFPLLQRIDPKQKNYANFQKAWEGIQTLLVLFFAYIQIITYIATLRPVSNNFIGQSIMAGIGVLFIIMGNYMGKVRQNWFVGVRTPWALEDPTVWQKSQRVGGWAFVLGGIIILISTFVAPTNFWVMIGVILLISLVPTVYSYVLAKKMGVLKK